MLRATLSHVVFPCGDAAATKLLPASLSLCQVRGRRRTLTPPPWVPPVHEKNKTDLIDPANRDLLRRVHEAERAAAVAAAAPAEAEVQAEMGSMCRRVGLMVTKIGMVPQWTNTGERMLCTLLHVEQNNVVSVTSPDEWYRRSLVGKRKAFNREGPLWKVTVGARDSDPALHPAAYRAQFARAGVQVKKQLGSFLVTEDAVPPVGIHLDARHFQVGQFVTASGRSIDWGFQGGMHRWGFRGQPTRRTTKSHRRIGSVGSVGDARIWPGKRMPGHMGHEWVTVSGLQVIRMNVDKQVIYVKGSVPGDIGETLLLKDCMQAAKQPKQIAIPTWTPSLPAIEEEAEEQEESPLGKSTEQFVPKLFRFSSPSIVFTADDEKRGVAKDRTKAKIAKVKK